MAAQNIITFGSCLSRYVARSYKRLFAGEIVASVYHNRSDYFLSSFVDAAQLPLSDGRLSVLEPVSDLSALDEDSRNIARNQSIEGIGRHKLDTSRNLFETLRHERVDLVLIDNFMDVAARLARARSDGAVCFLRPGDYVDFDRHFVGGDYIDPKQSAANFVRIVDFFANAVPTARICFLHFPFNTYEGDEARRRRSLSFLDHFAVERVHAIAPLSVPKIYRTAVASHFEEPQYTAYAGMVRMLVTR